MTRLSRRKETIVFVAITLALAYGLGGAFIVTGERHPLIIHTLMCVPGAVALTLMWLLRRESPRTVGFEFTGWGSWAIAALYPLVFVAAALILAYGVRTIIGHRDFIVFEPNNVQNVILGHRFEGLPNVPAIALWLLLNFFLWLLIALAYRRGAVGSLRTRAFLWFPIFVVPFVPFGQLFDLPGELGEEIGWRGYLVRRYAKQPLTAAAITMPVWALFHVPVIFFTAQRGHYVQNAAFLASIAVQAVIVQAIYLRSHSVWPCAVFHLSWNAWNPTFLGDVYAWGPGFFSGQFWVFNGEGPFGLLLNGAVALWLLHRWQYRRKCEPS
jgi:membrane protease YdiL (CAAX protease family)